MESDDDMKLPAGKTCADCVWCARCVTMFGAKPDNVVCDFAPSRFSQKK
jgi:hypothetical protein